MTQNGVTVGEYFFDGEGKRVKKVVYDPNGSGAVIEVTVFVYSNGKLIGEYSTKAPPQNPTTSYTATDQLGSPRVITNALGQVVSRRDFMPFGEEITPDTTYRTASLTYTSADNVRQKFTGYQKDDETDLDFAEARMYENRHGRFTAVDSLLASGKSADPQTFNRYVYVLNNPLILKDPKGLQAATSPNQSLQEESEVFRVETYWDRAKNAFGTFSAWLSNTMNNGGNFAQGVRYYSYTTGGEENATPDRTTGQFRSIINPTTGPSIAAFNRNMDKLNQDVIQRTPFLSSLVNAQMAGNDGKYGKFTFEMGMFGVDLASTVTTGGEARSGLSAFERASEFGFGSYAELKSAVKSALGTGHGLEVHHIIEKRFASLLGQDARQMVSIVLTEAEHDAFTRVWRQQIPYGAKATKEEVLNAAREVYKDHPEILAALGLQ